MGLVSEHLIEDYDNPGLLNPELTQLILGLIGEY